MAFPSTFFFVSFHFIIFLLVLKGCYVAHPGFELAILLLPPKYRRYIHVCTSTPSSQHSVLNVSGIIKALPLKL